MTEFVATVVDFHRPFQWLVALGDSPPAVASLTAAQWIKMRDLAPGDRVLIRFRSGRKLPRIVGYAVPRR